jgi:hypothetical protein
MDLKTNFIEEVSPKKSAYLMATFVWSARTINQVQDSRRELPEGAWGRVDLLGTLCLLMVSHVQTCQILHFTYLCLTETPIWRGGRLSWMPSGIKFGNICNIFHGETFDVAIFQDLSCDINWLHKDTCVNYRILFFEKLKKQFHWSSWAN